MNVGDYIVDAIKDIRNKGRFVFVCGNGGSAANAEHFTNDLFSKGVKAICLNSNVSIITMIANDFGYEYIFSKQLEILSSPEDLLIVFSCSGTSKNILEAMKVSIHSIQIFGGEGDYGDMESDHLRLTHYISRKL